MIYVYMYNCIIVYMSSFGFIEKCYYNTIYLYTIYYK